MYEFFPGSVSQEENWKDYVSNHINEHGVVWLTPIHFVWG